MDRKGKPKKERTIVVLYQKYGVIGMLLVEILLFSILSPNFRTASNFLTIGRQVSFTGIATVGCTLLMLTGGIDLSVGANLALSGVICTYLMINLHLPIWLCICATLLLGLLIGAVNGIAFTKLHISSLIATLAMQYILRGTGFLITDAKAIYNLPLPYKFLGQGYIFNVIPLPLVFMILFFAFGIWILNYTYLGRHIYAVGGNVEAARLSGIRTTRIYMYVFAASGMSASFAGVLMAARMGSGQPSIGTDFPMDVITAIVLGGVNINGGSGRIVGVLMGAFVMGILSNGMIMLSLNDYVQWLVKGIVLIFAVAMSNIYGTAEEA